MTVTKQTDTDRGKTKIASAKKAKAAKKTKRKKSVEEVLTPRFKMLLRQMYEANGEGVYGHVIESVETILIREALNVTEGNQVKAARLLGINRNTLHRKMVTLGIEV